MGFRARAFWREQSCHGGHTTPPSPAGMERSGIPVRVHGIVEQTAAAPRVGSFVSRTSYAVIRAFIC